MGIHRSRHHLIESGEQALVDAMSIPCRGITSLPMAALRTPPFNC